MINENLVNEEKDVTNKNNNSSNKNGIIALLVVIIIALIGAVVYFVFIKKDDKTVDNKGENNQNVDNNVIINDDETNNSSLSETKIELYVDEDKDQSVNNIKIGNKVFEIKLARLDDIKSDLYLNNKKVETIDYNNIIVSVVNKYLVMEWPGAQGGALAFAYVNEEGEYFTIDVEALNVYFENGKFYCDTTDDDAPDYDTKRVELILNGSKIAIKEIKKDNSQVNLTPSNQENINYSDWINYILSHSDLKAKAIRYDCDDESKNKTTDLTIEQLKSFFDKIKDNELTNYIMDGTGDSGCGKYLLLSYSVNSKTESLEIQEYRLWGITDMKLYNILENSNIRVDDTECTAENKECYSGYYGFKKEISFDDYFK